MTKEFGLLWTGKSIQRLSLHNRRRNPLNLGYGLEHLPFLFMYILSIYKCYLTIGEPYFTAMMELQEAGINSEDRNTLGDFSDLAVSTLSQGVKRDDSSDFVSTVQYEEVLFCRLRIHLDMML
jgi:hypothetical protein